MRTLLTNSRMAPELAARIEASVRGSKPGDAASAARSTALVRLVVLLAVVAVGAALVVGRREEKLRAEQDRAALLASFRAERASITERDEQALPRAESLLLREAGPYEGDVVTEALEKPAALDALLSEPTVYVHGPIDGFARSSRIASTAGDSTKDAFLLCLVDPPSSRSEPAVLPKVRAAYAGTGLEARTPNVRRLHDAEAGARLLSRSFEERIQLAQGARELAVLRAELDPDLLGRAKAAMKAKTLVAVMDEPGSASAPAELDGERPHEARVIVLDLAGGTALLRRRAPVDPGAWSAKARSQYASGLDQCALAFDVRQSLH